MESKLPSKNLINNRIMKAKEQAIQNTHDAYDYLCEHIEWSKLDPNTQIAIQESLRIAAKSHNYYSKEPSEEEIEAQPREVPDKRDCPICGSDDTFSFKQTCHKCKSCDYRFTK